MKIDPPFGADLFSRINFSLWGSCERLPLEGAPRRGSPDGRTRLRGDPSCELASFWGFSRSGGGVSSLHECARRQFRTKLIVCRGLLPSFALEFNKSSQARLKFQCKCHLPLEGGFGTNRPLILSFKVLISPINPNLIELSFS